MRDKALIYWSINLSTNSPVLPADSQTHLTSCLGKGIQLEAKNRTCASFYSSNVFIPSILNAAILAGRFLIRTDFSWT